MRKLRVGAMPPRGARRPDAATTDSLIAYLEGSSIARHRRCRPAGAASAQSRRVRQRDSRSARARRGRRRRCCRRTYAAFGFDNVADAQGSSPALLQAYLAAARKISAVAVGDPRMAAGSDTYTARQDLSQDVHLEGLPLGTVGGLRARHAFPVDGEYEFQVRLYRTNLSAIRGLEDPQEIELTLDGEPNPPRERRRREGSDRAADQSHRRVRHARSARACAFDDS